jgi:hypothetical protein
MARRDTDIFHSSDHPIIGEQISSPATVSLHVFGAVNQAAWRFHCDENVFFYRTSGVR